MAIVALLLGIIAVVLLAWSASSRAPAGVLAAGLACLAAFELIQHWPGAIIPD